MMGYCALEMRRLEDALSNLQLAAHFADQEKTATVLLEKARLITR
jgi:hypothetical protein